MKTGPDIALVASLVGDPARANMLTALMNGQALTATELSQEAGVTVQTASSHLAKLHDGGLVEVAKQGRHRYYRLTGPDVALVLEGLMGLAERAGLRRVRTGPKDPALRQARVCYDHLAGDLGVRMFDSMVGRKLIREGEAEIDLTPGGKDFLAEFGVELAPLSGGARPLCKTCLDWSARRSHLAGALGAAILDRLYALGWAKREPASRIVRFTQAGQREFETLFPA
ncbi:winged helix-turn-helix domain-containing protein [Inquilinus sp. CAU 1745]|uniref:ArsR/SmtB family transcription factor n=1 Tax=Inquilinus sp. CAU 1745 TaxID=3140369 RepID=UPI00325C175E